MRDRLRRIVCHSQQICAIGEQAGDGEADHHVVVDAEHIGAKALVDLGTAGLGYGLPPAGGVAVEVGHCFLVGLGGLIASGRQTFARREHR